MKNLTSSPGKTVVLYAQWQAVATEVNFGEHLIELKIGETYQLNPKIIPEDIKDVSLEYTTANVGVADVSEDGIITAIASGETEVSCRVRDNSSMESKVTVIVNELTSNQNMKDTLELDTGEKTVIQIHTAKELAAVSENLAGNYELKADLDLSGMEWKPLGDEENPFTGSFEGNGHSITGFVITDSSCVDYGLFGFMKGSVQNLVLDVKMQLGFSSGERDVYIGSITGRAEQSQLTNCISYTSISMENTKDLDLSFIHKNDTVGYCDAYTIITDCITYE